MKILKKLPYLLLSLGMATVFLISCEDDFVQEDLENLQDANLDAAIAALNNDGQFASALIKVVSVDEQPISGATVTISSPGANDGVLATQSVTTDASGDAHFPNIIAGASIVTIASSNHIDVLATASIGANSSNGNAIKYEIVNDQVIPIKTNAVAVLPMFPINGDSAIIMGQVVGELDVTNDITEIIAGATIRASLCWECEFNSEGSEHDFWLDEYSFNSSREIGTATTDSTGMYSMTVPTFGDGMTYSVRAQTFTGNQTIYVSSENGTDFFPELRTVTTTWGPSVSTSDIEQYPGAALQFDAPPAHGSGVNFTFTQRTKGIQGGNITRTAFDQPATRDNAVYHFTSIGGAGNTASPTVVITDPTGTGAGAEAHMEYNFTVLTAGGELTGYPVSSAITFDLLFDSPFNDFSATDFTIVNTTNDVPEGKSITVTSDATGNILQADVDTEVANQITGAFLFFDASSPEVINDWVTNLRFQSTVNGTSGDPAILTPSGSAVINQVQVTSQVNGFGNQNYTAPVFTFTGSTTPVALVVTQNAFQWDITIDNTASLGYIAAPDDITIAYVAPDANTLAGQQEISTTVTTVSIVDGSTNPGNNFEDLLRADGTGSIALKDASQTLRADVFSVGLPAAIVDDVEAAQANFPYFNGSSKAGIAINNGRVTSVNPFLISGTSVGGNQIESTFGEGYVGFVNATIIPGGVGAPGSGASVRVNINSNANGTVSINSLSVTSTGTGFRELLNINQRAFSASTPSVFVVPGDAQQYMIDYGTGKRKEFVQ